MDNFGTPSFFNIFLLKFVKGYTIVSLNRRMRSVEGCVRRFVYRLRV